MAGGPRKEVLGRRVLGKSSAGWSSTGGPRQEFLGRRLLGALFVSRPVRGWSFGGKLYLIGAAGCLAAAGLAGCQAAAGLAAAVRRQVAPGPW